MTGSQVINELCFARNYVTLSFYTVAHAIQSVSAMTSLKGKSEHYGSPGDHIKVFVIQYGKGRGFFLPFF